MEKITLSKKDRLSVAWRHQFLQGSWNYERMQNGGWCYSIIPAIKRIVVLPNHIRQFINAISPLALPALDKNLYGVSINPICISIELIGPPSENNVKNNMENADAMIRFGRYTTVLKKRVPFNLRRTSENHAPSTSDKMICGMKHMIHNNMVFLV